MSDETRWDLPPPEPPEPPAPGVNFAAELILLQQRADALTSLLDANADIQGRLADRLLTLEAKLHAMAPRYRATLVFDDETQVAEGVLTAPPLPPPLQKGSFPWAVRQLQLGRHVRRLSWKDPTSKVVSTRDLARELDIAPEGDLRALDWVVVK